MENDPENTPKNQEKETNEKKEDEEEISKETLIQLLKEKSREIKQVSSKLTKLENKYVKVFKEQKKFTKDRENLMKFLSNIFSQEKSPEYKKLDKQELGEVDSKILSDLFKKREQEKENAMNKVIQDYNKDKQKMESQYKQQIQERVTNMDQGNQELVSQLKDQIEELESNNTKLAKEMIDLNQVIQAKTSQIESLEKQDDMVKKMQADKLILELQQKNKNASESLDVSQRIKVSELENQIIQLKRDLDQANDKLNKQNQNNNGKTLPPQIQSYQKANQIQQQAKKKPTSNSETQTDSIFDPQTGEFVDRISLQNEQFNRQFGLKIQETPKNQKKISFSPQNNNNSNNLNNNIQQLQDIPLDDEENLTQEQRAKLNEQYLKNVILKYFEYLESKQHKEAGLLQNSIMTILRMTPEERDRIEQAKNKGSIWSYIPFMNKQQSNDSNGNGNNNKYASEILQTQ